MNQVVSVQVYDKAKRKSRSITVYGVDVESVAREVQRALQARWSTTSLNDRRHRR